MDTAYLMEKVMVAVDCLASGVGSFESRLGNAYVSALTRLEPPDAPLQLAGDLKWVLDLCARHQSPNHLDMNPLPESDRREVVEKLVRILIETSRMTG